MHDVRDQVAIVTGGASGMGRIIAGRLAARGARVAIFDINEDNLATAAGAGGFTPLRCDIGDRAEVEAAVARVQAELGPVDLLVHAAALMPSHQLIDHTHEDMERLFRINYFGTTYAVRAVLPQMMARGRGRIIAFGSIAGHALVPHMGAYCATKSAVNSYIEVLQNEIRDSGVKVHLVCPPAVNTPLIDQSLDTDSPGSLRNAKQSGRLADPEKIVDAIDKGVAKGRDIIYPGEARLLMLWHTLAPRLWWKTVLGFEK
ncbi:SDR family NAD(P)-dependent oxidoreductase [Parahaliea mediterranea]|uniref:SDR family oxidoreductase n=1 Tax=Parahaliea mediterranea TaxID=651086 RepID=A0A939DF94_9GAMM|nr:SDR family oxidoreductase [Parahaliea mediterranea]MBN7797089.1 SDR family oxidoreductase [Parahaliea mediterranea]